MMCRFAVWRDEVRGNTDAKLKEQLWLYTSMARLFMDSYYCWHCFFFVLFRSGVAFCFFAGFLFVVDAFTEADCFWLACLPIQIGTHFILLIFYLHLLVFSRKKIYVECQCNIINGHAYYYICLFFSLLVVYRTILFNRIDIAAWEPKWNRTIQFRFNISQTLIFSLSFSIWQWKCCSACCPRFCVPFFTAPTYYTGLRSR